MKKSFVKIISAVTALLLTFTFAGCNSGADNSSQPTTVSVTEPPTTTPITEKNVLKMLHTFNSDSDDAFAGAWRITEGKGENLKNFVFMFDGEETATLFTGNTGYLEKYSVKIDEDGNSIFTTQLMFGLNGSYTYEFNEDKTSAVLTSTEFDGKTTIVKLESFDCIPIPESNAQTDENILGAWMSEHGDYFFFDDGGIMYQNLYNKMFTYSTYSAKDGKINSKYNTGTKDAEEKYTYSVKDDVLTLNGFDYRRIPVTELK